MEIYMIDSVYIKKVKKAWGEERWLVNNELYCSKLLMVNKGATSSLHYHPEKQETFYCLQGGISLKVVDSLWLMTPYIESITIHPHQAHQFHAFEDSVMLEVSTHHNDRDVVRLTESESGRENGVV